LGIYNWTDAVSTAQNFKGGGFTDWRLPDKGELDLMYQNRTVLGGFLNAGYWSSTEYSTTTAWIQNFSTENITYYFNASIYTIHPGDQDWLYKSDSYRVRAVRAFSL